MTDDLSGRHLEYPFPLEEVASPVNDEQAGSSIGTRRGDRFEFGSPRCLREIDIDDFNHD